LKIITGRLKIFSLAGISRRMPLLGLTKKPGQTVTIGKDILIRIVKLQGERGRC